MSFFNFFKRKDSNIQKNKESVNSDAQALDNDIDMDVDIKKCKEKFLAKIQPYKKAGLLREIYMCDHFSAYAFGEILYIACPHIMLDGIPYGIFMAPDVLRRITKTHRRIYPIINEVFSNLELNKDIIFILDEKKIPWWKTWLTKNQHVDQVDKDLEAEIKSI